MSKTKKADDKNTALLKVAEENEMLRPLVETAIDLQGKIETYRKMPQIIVNKKNPLKQKATPAAKLYKETLQQYANVMRLILRAAGSDDGEEESIVREWMRKNMEM